MTKAVNVRTFKGEGDAPKDALNVKVFGGSGGGEGWSGTSGTVTIQETGATLDFDELKAIAQSDNPTVTATIIGVSDRVDNVYSRVIYSNADNVETIQVITSAVYSLASENIGVYWAEIERGGIINNKWDLSFIDVDKNGHYIGRQE